MDYMFDKCIYCRESNLKLTDEHILPLSLGGTEVLLKASCIKCQTTMSVFELDVARNLAGPMRVYFDAPTRDKKRRKKLRENGFPLHTERKDGEKSVVNIPIEEFGAVISFPEFEPPAYTTENVNRKELIMTSMKISRSGGLHWSELRKKYDSKQTGYNIGYGPIRFAKLIAKVAYCSAIQHIGIDKFKEVYILPCLLNQVNDMGKWIGGSPVELVKDQGIEAFEEKGDLYVRVRLFGNICPTYLVVVGSII